VRWEVEGIVVRLEYPFMPAPVHRGTPYRAHRPQSTRTAVPGVQL
jgi:hypothetical protein